LFLDLQDEDWRGSQARLLLTHRKRRIEVRLRRRLPRNYGTLLAGRD
jgi:hypothetical protein